MKIPFCHKEIEVGEYRGREREFRLLVAQIEVMGIPYLDALQKQDILIDKDEQMRNILKEKERYYA